MAFDVVEKEFAKFDKYTELMIFDGSMTPGDTFKKAGISKAVAEYIEGLGVASAAEMTFAQKCELVKIALKEQAVAFFTSPLGMATSVVAGIYLIIKAVDLFGESVDESREQLAELKNEYNSNAQEIQSLEDELKTTGERLDELNGKEKLSFAEQEELTRLQAQNAELQRTIDLLRLEQDLKQKEINKEFVDTMHKHRGTTSWDEPGIYDGTLETNLYKYEHYNDELIKLESQYQSDLATAISDGDEAQAQKITKQYEERRAEIESHISSAYKYLSEKNSEFMTDMKGVSYTPGAVAGSVEAEVNAALDYIGDFQDRLAIASGGKNAKTDAFNRLITQQFSDTTDGLKELGKEGKVTADMLNDPAYAEFVQKCIDIGIISDSSTESLNFLATGFNNLGAAAAGSVEGLAGTTLTMDQINSGIDGVQERISSLSDAFTKLSGGTMTLEEVIDLVQQFPELAEYVDLTAENFGDLDKGLQKLIRQSPDDLIEQLQNFKETADLTDKQKESIDALCESMEKLSTEAIKDATGEFGMLAEAIQASKTAKNELDKALAEDDHDANYEDRIEAFKGLKEVMEKGEFGSKAFAAYKEYFDIGELDSSGVKAWVQQNNKYFDEGKAGVRNFLAEIERLNKAGLLDESIASYDSATKTFAYDITQIEAIGEAFGWSGEMVQDFVGKFRMYSEDFVDRTTEITQKELLMRDYIQDFGDVAITSMEDLQAYTGYTEQGVRDLVDQMNALNSAVESELKTLSAGGNVDLNLRPEIDTSELLKAGWEEDVVGEAGNIATVFSSTFSNKAKNIAINFTPIRVDENGNFVEVLSPKRFEEYCQNVVDGVHDDYLNLQIGAEYTGRDAIKQAEADAQRIHELHAMMRSLGEIKILGVDDIHITQATIDSMSELLGSAEEVKAKIAELGKTEKVTFEAGIEFDGKTVEEIIAEASGDESNAVSVDVKLNINDEEIDVTLTTTEERLNALNKNWEAVLTGNTEDIEEKKAFVDTLLLDLEENVTTVTVDGYTYPAVDGLKGVSGWIDTVAKKNYQVVTVEYKTIGTPPQFAEGTKRAPEGPALLGDEYSPDGSPKPEMVITDGHAYIAGQSGPELVNLQEGDQVLTYDQTRKVLRGNPKVHKDAIPAFATGAGGFLAGSLAEQKYLEEQARIKREEEARAKAEAEAKAKAEAEAQKKAAQSSGSSAYWTNVKTYGTTDNRDTSAYYTSGTSSSKNNSTYTDGNPGGSLGSSGSGYGSGGGSGSSSSSSDSSSSSNEKSEFEKAYDYHQHLLAMEQEDYDDYLKWLERSYQEAYRTGQIELEDYLKYQEEVFNGQKELFQDGLSDIEHKIATLGRDSGNERQIINYYNQLISKIDGEIAAARARGLNDDDDYIQELLQQKWDYADEIADIQEEITENAKDAVDDLVDYRIDMLKQDLENEKDALGDKMSALKDFYDEQKQMLQDVRDEEKYLDEQSEKRKSVDDIRAEMDMLRFDDSAKAQKRMLELQEELLEAEKELSDFEKDHAFETTTDLLDKMYEQQESQIQSEIDELDARLNDPEALYNQALRDIQNNTLALYEEMVRYNAKYGSGNSQDITDMWNAADESLDAYLRTYGQAYKNIILSNLTSESTNGPKVPEIIPDRNNEPDNITEAPVSDAVSVNDGVVVTPNGNRYHLLGNNGSPFFNGSLPEFWKGSSGIGGQFMSHLFEGFVNNFGNIKRTNQPTQITTGDIVIQGNADSKTVSEIRRAQRENVDYMLREFIKLNR